VVQSRGRSRYRVDYRCSNPVVTEKGSFKAAAPIDSDLETMSDYITSTWPRLDIVRNSTEPTRLGFPKKSDASWSVRVNPLSYSSASTRENISSLSLTNGSNIFVRVNGPIIGQLKLVGTMNFPNPPTPTTVSFADMVKALKSDVMLTALDPEYSFGEPLGELRSTLSLIKDPIRSLMRMSKSFSLKKEAAKAASRTKRQYARAFAGTYAKYQFGFAPLVRSVQDAIDSHVNFMTHNFLAPQLKATRKKMSSMGTTRATANDTNLIISSSVSGLGTFFFNGESTVILHREARVGLYQTRPTPVSRREYNGLSASDLPQTLWELAPYSFMIDRLVNMKKFFGISRLLLNTKVEFRGGWVVERTRNTRVEQARLTGATGKTPRNFKTPPRITETFSMSRYAWEPNLSDVLPPQSGSGLLNSLTKTTDAVSLILLRLKK
jgi:hypothetical protein